MKILYFLLILSVINFASEPPKQEASKTEEPKVESSDHPTQQANLQAQRDAISFASACYRSECRCHEKRRALVQKIMRKNVKE